jgi:xanthine phosphoribosyltransferase
MEWLKRKILETGVVVNDQVLIVDEILTHQVDPQLVSAMGKEFAQRFNGESITKVVTIESSGIPIGLTTALELNVPLVFARRKKTLTTDTDSYTERVPSFTKGIVTDLMIAKQLLKADDRVLVIDDFIANGYAAQGLLRIIDQSGATVVGVGIAIEKSFQSGAQTIRESGVRLESLVRIVRLEEGIIELA